MFAQVQHFNHQCEPPNSSCEAAKECSPGRKPWVGMIEGEQAPEGRKKDTDAETHPFKCGNNSLNAADEDDRISS